MQWDGLERGEADAVEVRQAGHGKEGHLDLEVVLRRDLQLRATCAWKEVPP